MTFWGEGGCVVASPTCSEGREFFHGHNVPSQPGLWQVPACRAPHGPAGRGAYLSRVQFANSMHMAPRSWELIALSLLAGLGFGLALDHGDLFFVAVFGGACGMAIVGGIQRFP
jgi:hypothetical protein